MRWVKPPCGSGPERIEYEVNPRHAELIIHQLGLICSSRSVSTPNVKSSALQSGSHFVSIGNNETVLPCVGSTSLAIPVKKAGVEKNWYFFTGVCWNKSTFCTLLLFVTVRFTAAFLLFVTPSICRQTRIKESMCHGTRIKAWNTHQSFQHLCLKCLEKMHSLDLDLLSSRHRMATQTLSRIDSDSGRSFLLCLLS